MDTPDTLAAGMIVDAGKPGALAEVARWLVAHPGDWRACVALAWAIVRA